MARPRRPNEPSSYHAQPEIPPELRRRFDAIRAVLGERTTISEAARDLSIARVNMQSLVHRAETAMVEALQPRPTGPSPKPATERALEERVRRLEQENAKLQQQLQAADDMMAAAGEIIRSLRGLAPSRTRTSSRRSRPSSSASSPPATESDPEPEPTAAILSRALTRLTETTEIGGRVARTMGIDTKTLRRWLGRLITGEPIVRRRGGVRRPGPPAAEQQIRETVANLHGLVGAASLAHSVEGVSRRRAQAIKDEVMTELERTRRAGCARVEITTAGVVRGFDAMHLPDGFALVVSDASVPFRTSVRHVDAYDADHVAEVLTADFRAHGAPLVIREDRASCHTAEPVMSVLREHRVMLLQGPPRYPQYYGQLERQNREHRAWMRVCDSTSWSTQTTLDRMKTALNEAWHRPTLGWCSAAAVWNERPSLDEDRDAFADEVACRAAALRARSVPDDLAMRLAIEQALTHRGYLRLTPGR